MRVTADTNVLARIITEDEPRQSKIAQELLDRAEVVAIGTSTLCELVWVLRRIYKVDRRDIAAAIRKLIGGANVAVDVPAVEFGLATLEAGGDFADGAVAFEGRALGGETFVSFDQRAVKILAAAGERARFL
ncbi:MAG: type II toxin-antitoxin system VapC family toxin [Proteobacteria bacterium]|nr:type II toxin-antitoxin system VapC family toxin [Pseudomonadota bacterium]